jgi:hypothetical protein
VNVRVVLLDPGPETAIHYASIADAVHVPPERFRADARRSADLVAELTNLCESDPATYGGSIQVRWTRQPLRYTLWQSDGGSTVQISHLTPLFQGGNELEPSFRAGRGADQLHSSVSVEFTRLWNASSTATSE